MTTPNEDTPCCPCDPSGSRELKPDKLTLHAYDWTVEAKYTDDDRTAIHAWCLDRDSKPYLIRFNDFPVFCHVELPLFVNGSRMNWDENKASQYVTWLSTVLKEDKPERSLLKYSKKIYYFRGEMKFPMLLLLFKSITSLDKCEKLLSKPHPVRDIGMVMARVWESSISVVRKLLTLRDVRYSQWFTLEATRVDPEDCISSLEREYIGHWKTLVGLKPDATKGWTSHPGVLSFDIECYSNNHKAMPNQLCALHVSYMISLLYQRQGDPSSRKRYGILFGDCEEVTVDATRPGKIPAEHRGRPGYVAPPENVPGDLKVEIIRVHNEIEMIHKMGELVQKLDPEILIGYNILAFDYPYLDARLKRRLQEWRPMGRILNKPSVMSSKKWRSGAYGHNSINILHMDGRISLDMLPLIKRDYKYDSYGLDAVSKELLGEHRGKHDVKAEVQFRIYEELVNAKNNLIEKTASISTAVRIDNVSCDQPFQLERRKPINRFKDILLSNGSDILEDLRREYERVVTINSGVTRETELVVTALDRYAEARKEMTRVMKYCIEDSELVLDLFESLNIWIGLIELSNIVGVTIMDLFTRGQQVRCLSQIYDLAAKRDIVIDGRDNDGVRFSGGFVFEPKPGLYENIICLDFASLYPSIMQAFNICYTTLVPPEYMNQIPDEKCYVFDFDQEEDDDEGEDEEDPDEKKKRKEEGKKKKANQKKKTVHRHYKFVKPEVCKGILPELVRALVAERRSVRDLLDGKKDPVTEEVLIKKETDPLTRTILDKRQSALKVTANSFFGFLGVQNGGRLPLIEGAMCITARGRILINSVNSYLEKEKGAHIVYGDSVTEDTPLLLRYGGAVYYRRIGDLVDFGQDDTRSDGKQERGLSGIDVWSDQGWTPIKRVIRHKTDKKIYRIISHTGVVDVTEDHSLLRPDGTEVSPKQVKLGDELMHAPLPNSEIATGITQEQAFILGQQFALGDVEVPADILNASNSIKAVFIKGYKQQSDTTPRDKIGAAGLFYLERCLETNRIDNRIIDIQDLGSTEQYVYDLETENHHFGAGVGEMIVHNTDSTMVDVGITDPSKCNEIGANLSTEITKFINHPPLKMEFEKGMRRFLVLKKKMYMYTLTDDDGTEKLNEHGQVKIVKKGVAEARRDRCKWFRRVSDKISRCVLGNSTMAQTLNVLVTTIQDLLRGNVPISDLISIRELGAHYKSDTYFIKVFADNLRALGKIVNPGDRLEFIVVETGDPHAKVGVRMRSPEIFYERQGTPNEEKIDHIYYLEHVLMNPIDKIFSVGYNRILPTMSTVGYKPKGRYHFKPIAEPVKMMIRVLADASSLEDKISVLDRVRGLVDPPAQAPPMRIRLQIVP